MPATRRAGDTWSFRVFRAVLRGRKARPEQVFIVAAGGRAELAENSGGIADFLKAGGHLLALGLG